MAPEIKFGLKASKELQLFEYFQYLFDINELPF